MLKWQNQISSWGWAENLQNLKNSYKQKWKKIQSKNGFWHRRRQVQYGTKMYTLRKSHASLGAAEPPVMNMLLSSSSLTRQKWLVPMGSVVKGRPSFFLTSLKVGVLIVGLFYGARNYLSYTMQHFLAFSDSPISYHPIPLRRLPWETGTNSRLDLVRKWGRTRIREQRQLSRATGEVCRCKGGVRCKPVRIQAGMCHCMAGMWW